MKTEMFDLASLIAHARTKPDGIQHFGPDNSFRGFTPLQPAVAGSIKLTDLLPSIPAKAQPEYAPLSAKLASNKLSLAAALLEASQVAHAGAAIIPIAPAQMPEDAPIIAFYQQEARFSTITPATFSPIADGADVAVSPFPAHRAQIEIQDAPISAVHFEFSRNQLRDVGEDQIVAEISIALALGLARFADSLLLSAIVASAPAPFTLAAVAAKGLRFGELAAIIGTSGAGGVVSQDGSLRAAGIGADLTDTIAPTIAGAFSRSAVAIRDDISLVIERTDKRGTLRLTALVNAKALVSDPAAFWTVA
ncbi:hypothetical protein LJR296_002439 [Cupriavidus necator]|uniref:hypothetical protein n=1 Tax=Cupriavidus necator TaxID=106590 RepID=UPI003ECF1E2C